MLIKVLREVEASLIWNKNFNDILTYWRRRRLQKRKSIKKIITTKDMKKIANSILNRNLLAKDFFSCCRLRSIMTMRSIKFKQHSSWLYQRISQTEGTPPPYPIEIMLLSKKKVTRMAGLNSLKLERNIYSFIATVMQPIQHSYTSLSSHSLEGKPEHQSNIKPKMAKVSTSI